MGGYALETDPLVKDKLELLRLYFPLFDQEVLKEVLGTCNGSVDQTKLLINGRSGEKGNLYQTSIVKNEARRPMSQKKVVTLNTPEEIDKTLGKYVCLKRNFLPKDFLEILILYLESIKHRTKPNEFYLFEQKCKANHSSLLLYKEEIKLPIVYNGLNISKTQNKFDSNLMVVSNLINDFINDEIIPNSTKLPYQQPKFDSNACVVNYYSNNSNNLDWHSDRLSHIGPHNFIASLSLGLTRYFRLRKNYTDKTIYQIPLPNNCLLIMKPGCQEEFKHCVQPINRSLQLHPTLGTARFNLTFRYYPPSFIKNLPICKCDLTMTLRRSYKTLANRGKYFWSCENKYQNKDCGTFHWADFNNKSLIADNNDNISYWIANDDFEKLNHLKNSQPISQNLQ